MTPYDLRAFGRFTRMLRLEDSRPLVLERFQREVLTDHFGPARELVELIPKKNYKTTTLAALGLFHIGCVIDAEAIIVAASRDQAGVLFRQASKMLRRSGDKDPDRKDRYRLAGLTYELREGYREIRCTDTGGRLKVMAADADTADGVIPTLALVDELHRHRSAELYGVLADGLGPRKGRQFTISTAGTREDSPLGEIRRRAHKIGGTLVNRHLRVAKGPFVFHEWALLEDRDNPDNLTHVLKANPAKTQDRAELERRRSSPTMTPGRWLRFACGIWTEGDEPAVEPARWDAARVDIGALRPGDPVFLAVQPGEEAWIGFAGIPSDGGRVAVDAEHLGDDRSGVRIERRLLELVNEYDVLQVAYPKMQFLRSAELMEAQGLYMVDVPAQAGRYGVISQTFHRMLAAGQLSHDGNPALRASVLAATAKDSETGWRYLMTPKAAGLFAVANALHQATAVEPEPPRVVFA